MPDIENPFQVVFVIQTKPTDPTSYFAVEMGERRIGICVFTQKVHAMQFEKNAQGLWRDAVTPVGAEALIEALKVKKSEGATHVLIDPSASSGASDATDIDEYISLIQV